MTNTRITYCVDVGSVRSGNFGWARVTDTGWEIGEGTGAAPAIVERLRNDCSGDDPVSIGFESPLFLPLRTDPMELGRARGEWEHSSFAGGLGASVLVTGLVQLAYVLRDAGRPVTSDATADQLEELVVWEAFVSGRATASMTRPDCPGGAHGSHACDALVAALEWHGWSAGKPLRDGQLRWARDFRYGADAHGFDIVAAVTGRAGLIADPASWNAAVLQLPKPMHSELPPGR